MFQKVVSPSTTTLNECGIYLPLEVPIEQCIKNPICLSFYSSHFVINKYNNHILKNL